MSDFQDVFREEAVELLAELEESLLELEQNFDDIDIVDRIFRSMHTIKGSGGMCGFPNVCSFTHELETAFDKVRKKEVSVTRELIDIGLDSHQYIDELIDASDELSPALRLTGKDILARLQRYSPSEESPPKVLETINIDLEQDVESTTMRIRFEPCKELLTYGMNPLVQLKDLAELGKCNLVAYTSKVPPLAKIEHDACYISWEILITTEKSKDEVFDVFSIIDDDCELVIDIIDQEDEVGDGYKRLGDILIDRGDLTKEQVDNLFDERPLVGEKIKQAGLLPQEKIKSALLEQETVREQRQERQQSVANDTIRVSALKLDHQMNLVGELVIGLARLNQLAEKETNSELTSIADELDQLITQVRDNVLGIRMLPIGSTFNKFRRLVRDLSTQQGKDIELITHGAETELDKTVIEQLGDPLVHLIRNSLDHGIEDPEIRVKNGKNAKGEITLSAKQANGKVVIEISDDGKGIDPQVIRKKAIEKNIISAEDKLSDKEILTLIFAAGFSTAESITNISGRGVGMDVVKRAIDSLRGTIGIESVVGKGTTITLELPLTLAIIEGLIVEVGIETLVIPLSVIEECLETKRTALKSSKRGDLVQLRNKLIPCISLNKWLGHNGELPDLVQVIIVNVDGEQYGLIVDDILGQQQIVMKSLGKIYQSIEGVSGATILGDGSVAIILDLQQIIQMLDA